MKLFIPKYIITLWTMIKYLKKALQYFRSYIILIEFNVFVINFLLIYKQCCVKEIGIIR